MHMINIRAIIFDFGNVLVRWDARNLYKRYFPTLQAVDLFLQQIHFAEWNQKQDAGRSFHEGVAELSKEFPQYTELIRAYDTYWEESLVNEITETINLAKQLKSNGLSLYILTNSSAEKFPLAKQKYPFLEELFEDIIVSGEHKLLKPDPAIYRLTLQRINRKANECIFVDDSLPNIETARLLGFHAIHYHSPAQLKQELQNLSILI